MGGSGFKSRPGKVSHYDSVKCSIKLKTRFDLNPVTEGKQWTVDHYMAMVEVKIYPYCMISINSLCIVILSNINVVRRSVVYPLQT